ncbi:hypothetical protein BC941DRAFT_421985 [Chlamydoabsidia padenii]|nr:hypothetical protein BC941DRAFT_421985 [Chlamydoabsidia padenii]
MFGQQYNTNTHQPTNIDILNKKSLGAHQSDSTAPGLFASSTGQLFRSVQDSTQVLPPHIKKLELGNVEPTPSTLLPLEGRITKAAQDNALPIFFAGARPSNNTQPTPENESIVLNEKRPSLIPEQPTTESSTTLLKEEPTDNNSTTDDLRTIKIFGFPSGLGDVILSHFEKYGRIEESRYSPGNSLTIRYAYPASVTAALKSNGMILADTFMIGVTMVTDTNQIPSTPKKNSFTNIVPTSLDNNRKPVELGSGQVGIMDLGCNTINPTGPASIVQTTGWIGFLKDALFSW